MIWRAASCQRSRPGVAPGLDGFAGPEAVTNGQASPGSPKQAVRVVNPNRRALFDVEAESQFWRDIISRRRAPASVKAS
jgi:hypothetical protein